MKKVAGYGLVFVLVFATSLIVYFPAYIVIQQLPLPPQLKLSGVQGTIWQGKAEQVRWQNHDLGDLSWSVSPVKLVSASLEASVRFGRGSDLNLHGKGIVGYNLNGAYAKNLLLSLPADEALKQASLPIPVTAKGQLELTIKDYVYQAPVCLSGDGNLAWISAGVESPLGNLSLKQAIADIQCAKSTVDIKGNQQSGQVSSEFSAKLSPNFRYQAQGWFKPGAEFPEQFAQQLKWLPKPDNQGQYQFKHQGRL